MQFTLATVLAMGAAVLASPAPQGVTSAISPKSTMPAGCSSSYSGKFEIEVVNVTSSHSKRDALVLSLSNGVLLDAQGRTGYIAANQQFQFDKPAQTGAIYTAGWSVCGNGSLALGGSTIFYSCLSGTFYNLYDQNVAAQCVPVYIQTTPADGTASQQSDGQPTASPVAGAMSDGQPTASVLSSTKASSAAPVSQLSDGQVQASTKATSTSSVSVIASSAAPVTQISDGQIQASTKAATTASVTITSSAKSSSATNKVTQISDGQIQAPTGANNTVSTATRSSVVAYTGAAVLPTMRSELFGLAAGVLAAAMF